MKYSNIFLVTQWHRSSACTKNYECPLLTEVGTWQRDKRLEVGDHTRKSILSSRSFIRRAFFSNGPIRLETLFRPENSTWHNVLARAIYNDGKTENDHCFAAAIVDHKNGERKTIVHTPQKLMGVIFSKIYRRKDGPNPFSSVKRTITEHRSVTAFFPTSRLVTIMFKSSQRTRTIRSFHKENIYLYYFDARTLVF